MPEKADIIARCKKGDRDAFNTLISEYQSKVINIAYGVIGDREDALDAAQEAFVKIYKNISSFRGGSSLDTWIYRVTVNVCTDMLRKRGRIVQAVSMDARTEDDEPKNEIASAAPSPDEIAESNDTARLVRAAINTLSPEYREVITLFDIEGFSYSEICDILHLPPGTVKSRLSRARAALKKVLYKNKEHFL